MNTILTKSSNLIHKQFITIIYSVFKGLGKDVIPLH